MTNITWKVGQKKRLLGMVDEKIAFSLRTPNRAIHSVELATRNTRTNSDGEIVRSWSASDYFNLEDYEGNFDVVVVAAKARAEELYTAQVKRDEERAQLVADTAERTAKLFTYAT